METQNHQKTAIWMDHNKAIVIGYYPDHPFAVENMESPMENHVRFEGETNDKTRFIPSKGGSSNNEVRKNNTYENQLKKYFQALEQKVIGTEDLILLGPGILKNQFFKHLKDKKNLSSLKIRIFDVDKLTHNQLLAFIKDQFED
jgi:hypothetical protein